MRSLAALFVTAAAVLLLAGCDTDEIHIDYDGDVAVDRCLSFADIGSGSVRETWAVLRHARPPPDNAPRHLDAPERQPNLHTCGN